MSIFDLTGKTAIITGANTGLGQGMCVALAQAGANIVGVGRSDMSETQKMVEEIGVPFLPVHADLLTLDPYALLPFSGRREAVPEAGTRRQDHPYRFDALLSGRYPRPGIHCVEERCHGRHSRDGDRVGKV